MRVLPCVAEDTPEMTSTALRRAAPAILLAAVVLLPFHDKAFTIDDTVFLAEATHALSDPLHPTAFTMTWTDVPQRLSDFVASGPVMAWLLVPSALAGGAEWLAHAVVFLAMAIAILATVALGLRLGLGTGAATVAGLVLASTPAALAMAATAMPDVPAMALGVSGLERLLAWKQERRVPQAILAAVLLGLAPLARSHLLLLVVIGALLVAGDFLHASSWRAVPAAAWAPLAAAPLVTLGVLLLTRDPMAGAEGLLGAIADLSSLSRLGPNSVALATHWVLPLPLAVPWLILRPGSFARRWWLLLLATAAAAALLYAARDPLFPLALVAGLGAAVLWDVLASAWTRRDALELLLGIWLLVPLPVAAYTHMSSKYLLASAPAMAILIAREASVRGGVAAKAALGIACVLGVALGVAIIRADAAFAGIGRRAAAELIAPRVAAGQRVWFAGHWGFQWYAERAGARCVTLAPPYPASGDLVVTSLNSLPGVPILDFIAQYPRLTHLGSVEDHSPGGRIMDPAVGAGFYSNAWGYLPWGWGSDALDEFHLWRID